MTKPDYSHLTADEATRAYGDLLEKSMNILRDKGKGTLSTLFSIVAMRFPNGEKWTALHDAMLEKNGIKKIEQPVCYDYLPEVIAAAEARGSDAADKLKLYKQFVKECEAVAKATAPKGLSGPFAGIRENYALISARIEAAKNWVPAP